MQALSYHRPPMPTLRTDEADARQEATRLGLTLRFIDRGPHRICEVEDRHSGELLLTIDVRTGHYVTIDQSGNTDLLEAVEIAGRQRDRQEPRRME